MDAYLHGSTNADSGEKRLKALREDDKQMKLDGLTPVARQNLERRRRGKPDKIMKAKMEIQETKRMEAALANADAEVILNTEQSGLIEVEHEMEKTYKLSQLELRRDHVDEQTARQIYDLKLGQYAPYGMSYDRSGRYGLLRGHGGGHVALMDCHTLALRTEFHVNEIIRDGTFLHNPTMFALAQKKHAFIYDDSGAEIHRMSDHTDIFRIEFLPYHWLLGEYHLTCFSVRTHADDARGVYQITFRCLYFVYFMAFMCHFPPHSHGWEGRISQISRHVYWRACLCSPN